MAPRHATSAPNFYHATQKNNASKIQCVRPIDDTQDGVCGCPQFWQPKPPHNHAQHNTSAAPSTPKAMIDVFRSPFPSPTPSGPPQQTCFFWYHGTCRRDHCSLAHEAHVTWPLTAPPRFVHYEPCYLPLCPLRDDLVPSKQTKRQLASQRDGQALSSGTRETPIEVVSSDEESYDTNLNANNVEEKQDRDDPDSLPDYEDLDTVPDSVVIRNTTYLSSENDRSHIIAPESPREVLPFFDDDVIDLPLSPIFIDGGSTSTYTSAVEDQEETPPAFEPGSRPLTGPYTDGSDSDCDTLVEEEVKVTEKTLLTTEPLNIYTATAAAPTIPSYEDDLSESAIPVHRSDANDEDEPVLSLSHAGTLLGKRSRTTSPNEGSNNKRLRREETPELDAFVSQVDSWDRRPANDLLPTPYTLKPPPPFQISGNALRVTTRREITPGDCDTSPSSLLSPYTPTPCPTGPRALGGGALVCFYWYHTGHCKPNRRNGRTMSCNYAHHLDNPRSRVSRPPHARSHDPDCQLPLCPIRLRQTNRHTSNDADEQGRSPCLKADEPLTPSRSGFVDANAEYSSPRDGISEARSYLKGYKGMKQQLPKLTGPSCERFKQQKKAMEKWQADNNVTTHNAMQTLEEMREARRLMKQQRRQKKEGQRTISATTPDDIATSTKRGRKQKGRAMTGRRASALYNADLANGGRIQKSDKEAELYSDKYQPPDGFPDSDPEDDPLDETESVRERGEKTLRIVEALKMKTKDKRRSLRPLTADQTIGGKVSKKADKRAATTKVEYAMPEGEARLDWDTDLVRRLFGEIE